MRLLTLGYKIVVMLLLVGFWSACAQMNPVKEPTAAQQVSLLPVLAVSELMPGWNRLAFGVLKNGTPVNDPDIILNIRLSRLNDTQNEQPHIEVNTVYRGEGLPLGIYVAYANFEQPGEWVATITTPVEGEQPQIKRMRLDVLAQSRAPAVGDPAPASTNLTVADVPDLAKLTSDVQPDPDLYQLSIADALQSKKPFLVTFSTPGYCQTAVCAPNLQVIKQLKALHKGVIHFVHVEIYPYPFAESYKAQHHVPEMDEWNLSTEPWTFLVDAQGLIQARYEGGITLTELTPALEQLAAGKPIIFETVP